MNRQTRIAQRFGRASATYDQAAQIQAQSAALLAEQVLSQPWQRPRGLEIGCGTGGLTRLVLPHVPGQWLITDIAPGMVAQARQNMAGVKAEFAVQDGQNPALPPGQFDLIMSNLAVQWFDDLGQSLPRLAALLAPGGRMFLTTLGAGSLPDWRQAAGDGAGTPSYPSAQQLAQFLPGAQITHHVLTQSHASGLDFLHGLKAIGAAEPKPGHRPAAIPAMRQALKRLGSPCMATYDVVVLEWKKP